MTLGVIDECRQFGLGTELLRETYNCILTSYPSCDIVYLHVVTYNNAAIRFYKQKNGYIECKREANHYMIFDKEYDALLLYVRLNTQRESEDN